MARSFAPTPVPESGFWSALLRVPILLAGTDESSICAEASGNIPVLRVIRSDGPTCLSNSVSHVILSKSMLDMPLEWCVCEKGVQILDSPVLLSHREFTNALCCCQPCFPCAGSAPQPAQLQCCGMRNAAQTAGPHSRWWKCQRVVLRRGLQ